MGFPVLAKTALATWHHARARIRATFALYKFPRETSTVLASIIFTGSGLLAKSGSTSPSSNASIAVSTAWLIEKVLAKAKAGKMDLLCLSLLDKIFPIFERSLHTSLQATRILTSFFIAPTSLFSTIAYAATSGNG